MRSVCYKPRQGLGISNGATNKPVTRLRTPKGWNWAPDNKNLVRSGTLAEQNRGKANHIVEKYICTVHILSIDNPSILYPIFHPLPSTSHHPELSHPPADDNPTIPPNLQLQHYLWRHPKIRGWAGLEKQEMISIQYCTVSTI